MTSFINCSQCGQRKQVGQFHKDSARHNGRRAACKACEGVGRDKWPELQGVPVDLLNKCWKPLEKEQ